MHGDSGFAFVALESDGFHKDFNRANPQDCSSQANELVNQMRLDHREREYMGKVREPEL